MMKVVKYLMNCFVSLSADVTNAAAAVAQAAIRQAQAKNLKQVLNSIFGI